jgi:hypothetical protein
MLLSVSLHHQAVQLRWLLLPLLQSANGSLLAAQASSAHQSSDLRFRLTCRASSRVANSAKACSRVVHNVQALATVKIRGLAKKHARCKTHILIAIAICILSRVDLGPRERKTPPHTSCTAATTPRLGSSPGHWVCHPAHTQMLLR